MRERFGFIDAIFTKLEEFKAKFDFIRDNWSLMVEVMRQRFNDFIQPLKERLAGPVDALSEKLTLIKSRFGELKTKATDFRDTVVVAFQDFMQPKLDTFTEVMGRLKDGLASVKDFGGNVASGVRERLPEFSAGGIASGPSSGYPAVLHGTEAVVPLAGGRSIPVEMKGGGSGSQTFNITINPSGITDRTDKREMARQMGNMIQQEVSRALGGTTMRGRF